MALDLQLDEAAICLPCDLCSLVHPASTCMLSPAFDEHDAQPFTTSIDADGLHVLV